MRNVSVGRCPRRTTTTVLVSCLTLGLILTLGSRLSYAGITDMYCGGMKIQAVTRCVGESSPAIPDCAEQTFSFVDDATGKKVSSPAAGQLVAVKNAKGELIGKYLDALATGWVCARGRTQSYLIVWYNTGGNCPECEWQEILDLNGKKIASTLPKTKKNLKSYKGRWVDLGLPSLAPKDFSDLRLTK
jgi:hypothetical protein